MDFSPNAPKIKDGALRYATTHPTKKIWGNSIICVYTVALCRGEEWKRGFSDPVKSQLNRKVLRPYLVSTQHSELLYGRVYEGCWRTTD